MTASDARPQALLMLGPTGVGKTPLGEVIAERGLHGRRCVHFDFGERLRGVTSAFHTPTGVGEAGTDIVRRALTTGALLEDHEFWIAEAILADFLTRSAISPNGLVVLNGLPRHAGQARDVDGLLNVRAVVLLTATADVVLERIRLDTGGDRASRTDDEEARVLERLARYERRTLPLIEHYEAAGASLLTIDVGRDTPPAESYRALRRLAEHRGDHGGPDA